MPRKDKKLKRRRPNPGAKQLRAIMDAGGFADAMLSAGARLSGNPLEQCPLCGAAVFSVAIHFLSCPAAEAARERSTAAAPAGAPVVELKKQKDGTYGEK